MLKMFVYKELEILTSVDISWKLGARINTFLGNLQERHLPD